MQFHLLPHQHIALRASESIIKTVPSSPTIHLQSCISPPFSNSPPSPPSSTPSSLRPGPCQPTTPTPAPTPPSSSPIAKTPPAPKVSDAILSAAWHRLYRYVHTSEKENGAISTAKLQLRRTFPESSLHTHAMMMIRCPRRPA